MTTLARVLSACVLITLSTTTASALAGRPVDDTLQRREQVQKAVAWLAKASTKDEWNKVSIANAQAKRAAVILLCAWLLEANPDIPGIDKARRYYRDQADQIALRRTDDISFCNWIDGFATLYVWERSLREKKPHPALEVIVHRFIKHQNKEGGWGHGSRTEPEPYPSTLIATTNLALLALGAAERFQLDVSKEVDFREAVADGLALLQDVQGPHGGLPYGGRVYRKGYESGRTAAALLPLVALAKTDTDLFRRAVGYTLRNLDSIPRGHASETLHIALGALACFVLSEETWLRYNEKILTRVRAWQQTDGSFSLGDGVHFDTVISLGGDGLINSAYITVFCAAALSVDRTEIGRSLRANARVPRDVLLAAAAPTEGKVASPAPPEGKASWFVELKNIVSLASSDTLAAVLPADGTLRLMDVASGRLLRAIPLGTEFGAVRACRLAVRADTVIVVQTQAHEQGTIVKAKTLLDVLGDRKGTYRLWCFGLKDKTPRWSATETGFPRRWLVDQHSFLVLTGEGDLTAFSLADGSVRHRLPVSGGVNMDFASLPDDHYAVASESRLRVHDARGGCVWENKLPIRQGVNPAAYGTLAVAGDQLFAGRTDGQVECRNWKSGDLLWSADVGTCVRSLASFSDEPAWVVAFGYDGVLYGVRDRKVRWKIDIDHGQETHDQGQAAIHSSKAGLFISSPARQQLLLIDPRAGRIQRRFARPELFSVTEKHLLISSPRGVGAYPPY